MRLTCPCCGASYGLEVLLADRSAREAVAAALALPASLGERLLRYIGLFRPRERALSWDRAARLLTELQEAINAAQIERDGRIYPAPVEYWKAAIDQMLDGRDRLSLPLKSHGYLYEIIAGMSKRADERSAARNEVESERAQARQGERSGRMQSAGDLTQNAKKPGEMPDNGNGIATSRDGARIDETIGEILTGHRPARVPPPPDFRALAARLMGKTIPENADDAI